MRMVPHPLNTPVPESGSVNTSNKLPTTVTDVHALDSFSLTQNTIRRHGRPRSHAPMVTRIDHETLDAVLKEMDR